MLEEGEEASHSAINDAIVKEYREYGVGDLQPRYEKIAKALTTMRVYNKGKKSQGEEKPSKKEVEDFVKSELVRIDQTTKARA
jgi:ATP-dependent Lon protease